MSEVVGVKELKEAVDLALGVVKAAGAVTADGKVDLADIGALIELSPLVGPGIAGADQIPAELKDLSAEEAAEVSAHVMAKLVVKDAKARKIIEDSLAVALALHKLVKTIRAEEEAPLPAA